MDSRRWFDPHQPQTLQVSQILLYINAFFGALAFLTGAPFSLITALGCGGAAFGIANEKRWGYTLGIVVATLDLLLVVVVAGGFTGLFSGTALIPFIFAAALVAALVHPMSREYQKIWFR